MFEVGDGRGLGLEDAEGEGLLGEGLKEGEVGLDGGGSEEEEQVFGGGLFGESEGVEAEGLEGGEEGGFLGGKCGFFGGIGVVFSGGWRGELGGGGDHGVWNILGISKGVNRILFG